MTSRNANLYMTLSEFKAQLGISDTDTTDDDVLSQTLEEASRSIDDMTGRFFYPNVATLYFDTPIDDRLRFWYDDLLEPLSVVNGSEGALSSTDYNLIPYNATPYVALALKSGQGLIWTSDSDNITEKAISLTGIWGYRKNYTRDGWHQITTLDSAINLTVPIKVVWESDSAGSASGTTVESYTGLIYRFVTVPSSTSAPDDNYDVVVTDKNGVDVLMGAGANRDTANTEFVTQYDLGAVVDSQLTFTISNAGDTNAGTIYLYVY